MPPASGVRGIYILFVDDHEDSREVTKAVLEHEGAIVDVAGSVADALAKLRALLPDVIITDVKMPRVDGLAFLKELKDSPAWCAIPVIACTGVTGSERELAAAGFAEVIVKPLDPMRMIPVIARALARRTVP
jgi:CheY-like chemotaxis protein